MYYANCFVLINLNGEIKINYFTTSMATRAGQNLQKGHIFKNRLVCSHKKLTAWLWYSQNLYQKCQIHGIGSDSKVGLACPYIFRELNKFLGNPLYSHIKVRKTECRVKVFIKPITWVLNSWPWIRCWEPTVGPKMAA